MVLSIQETTGEAIAVSATSNIYKGKNMECSVSATVVLPFDHIIYKTTYLVNNKFYIGKHYQVTSGFDGYLGSGDILLLAIKKYGRENFIRETIEYCTSANVDDREKYWIAELSATDKNIGYNITFGGRGGHKGIKRSNETKRKIGLCKKGNSYMLGKKMSEESKQKNRNSHQGKKHSKETREKISKIVKGRKYNHPKGVSRYTYTLSNGENYWTFFNTKQLRNLVIYFHERKSNIITHKGITIERKLRK